mmetsp:Transcript_3659/g.5038  ORF Transcript_3659/g.5038 Transcript_3659/m.5038 type:complete len:333 (-) Transcript_3659:59-1057(-)
MTSDFFETSSFSSSQTLQERGTSDQSRKVFDAGRFSHHDLSTDFFTESLKDISYLQFSKVPLITNEIYYVENVQEIRNMTSDFFETSSFSNPQTLQETGTSDECKKLFTVSHQRVSSLTREFSPPNQCFYIKKLRDIYETGSKCSENSMLKISKNTQKDSSSNENSATLNASRPGHLQSGDCNGQYDFTCEVAQQCQDEYMIGKNELSTIKYTSNLSFWTRRKRGIPFIPEQRDINSFNPEEINVNKEVSVNNEDYFTKFEAEKLNNDVEGKHVIKKQNSNKLLMEGLQHNHDGVMTMTVKPEDFLDVPIIDTVSNFVTNLVRKRINKKVKN